MKKLVYILGSLFLFSASFTACSSDYDDPPEQPDSHQDEVSVDSVDSTQDEGASKDYSVISPVPVSEEVKAFFDEALPYLPGLPIELSPFLFQSNVNSEFFVLNSEQELRDVYKGEKHLPQLDFEQNTLIIGQMLMPGASFYLESVELRVYDDRNVLAIYTREPPYLYSTLYNLYFWGLFPKIENNISDLIQINRKEESVE